MVEFPVEGEDLVSRIVCFLLLAQLHGGAHRIMLKYVRQFRHRTWHAGADGWAVC